MSGISAGIGLISGIDTASLIDQLIALDSRPIVQLQVRVQQIDIRRAAFLELSAKLLAVRNAITNFDKPLFFNRFTAGSSNEDVVTAVASEQAQPGVTSFRVHSLVSSQAMISRGFADADTTAVGRGDITLEFGQARVNRGTSLGVLNGGNGVRSGVINITDRSGATAKIDLRTASTIEDVLRAINTNTSANVRASVTSLASNGATGDRIVIEDLSGGTGRLIISDGVGGFAAKDLGIVASVAADRVDGTDLVRLSMDMPLSLLNDGNGIDRTRNGDGTVAADLHFQTGFGEFDVSLDGILAANPNTDLRVLNQGNGIELGVIRVTDRAGQSVEIDLTDEALPPIRTFQDLHDRISNAVTDAELNVSVTFVNSQVIVSDSTNVPEQRPEDAEVPALLIEDLSGSTAADLGIAGRFENGSAAGRSIYAIETVGDVIRAINFAHGNDAQVEAAISKDGNSIVLRALGFNNSVTVTAGTDNGVVVSGAALDLGILGATFTVNESFQPRPIIAGLNTVLLSSLNGGSGVDAGTITLTDRLGHSATVDFSEARMLQDVIDLINADEATSLVASVNGAGNGITLRDESEGTGPIIIADGSGSLATDLGIAGTFDVEVGASVNGGNAQLQYVSHQTLLSDLNGGRGVNLGDFRITDSTGAVHVVSLPSNVETIGQVIDAINRTSLSARINDTGDGILVTDSSEGALALTIEDQNGGRTAADLRLVGSAGDGENFIDGSYEIRITIGAGDSLEEVARKINNSGAAVSAAILRDGSAINPVSLTLTSTVAGRRGELVIDTGDIDLGLSTMSRAQDAVVSLGGESPRLITSSTNTLDDVIEGVTFNLLSTSEEEVTVTVSQDVDGIIENIRDFVDRYNSVLDTIAEATSFDSETYERGTLFGDNTVDLVQSRLRRVILQPFEGVNESFSRLFSIGLRLGSRGRLEFDDEDFREAYANSPEQVENLFSAKDTGFGAVLQGAVEALTREFDGVLARKDDLLSEQQDLLNDRIDRLGILLDAKRARLEAQFIGLEMALAGLQEQQFALASLATLV